MYKYANKHAELFKKIPFEKFSAHADFINSVVTNPNKFGSFENILKCYFYISEEIWDYNTPNFLLRYNERNSTFYVYDFISNKQRDIKSGKNKFKQTKMIKSVLNKDGTNCHHHKETGLIINIRQKDKKKEIAILRNQFLRYAYMYNDHLEFYKKNKYEIPEEWLEHLYVILQEIVEKADVFYRQRAYDILTKEIVNVLCNEHIVLSFLIEIKTGCHSRADMIKQLKEHKQYMFGEITHQYQRIKH
ncbi:MAG: hypothetical protein IKN73_02020 [Alphaproteobacteria bacterium]|nr:hypothetical protein [Alphaproteobacteria bacterium]